MRLNTASFCNDAPLQTFYQYLRSLPKVSCIIATTCAFSLYSPRIQRTNHLRACHALAAGYSTKPRQYLILRQHYPAQSSRLSGFMVTASKICGYVKALKKSDALCLWYSEKLSCFWTALNFLLVHHSFPRNRNNVIPLPYNEEKKILLTGMPSAMRG